MKPHPHIRKIIQWGGAVATLLLVLVWIASMWVGVSTMTESRGWWYVGSGRLQIARDVVYIRSSAWWPNVDWYPVGFGVRWGFENTSVWGGSVVPLWLPALCVLLPTGAAWRLDFIALRRARTGCCAACGYDRAGLAPSVVCPECGTLTKS